MEKTTKSGMILMSKGGKKGGSELKLIPHLIAPKKPGVHYVLKDGQWVDSRLMLESLEKRIQNDVNQVRETVMLKMNDVASQKTFLGLLTVAQVPRTKVDGTYFIMKEAGKLDGQPVAKGDTVYVHNGQYLVDPNPSDVLSNVHIDASKYQEGVDLFLYYDSNTKTWNAVNQLGLKRTLGISALASAKFVPVTLGGTGHTTIKNKHILVGNESGQFNQVSISDLTYSRPLDYTLASSLEGENCVPNATTVLNTDDKTMKAPHMKTEGTTFKVLSPKADRSIQLNGKTVKIKKNREYSFISFEGSWIQFKTQ